MGQGFFCIRRYLALPTCYLSLASEETWTTGHFLRHNMSWKLITVYGRIEVLKKTEKPIKPGKPEKKKPKKPNRKKKPIKPIKILKKLTGSVRFRFFKHGTGKTEPNWKKPGKNRAKPKKPSQTGFFSKKPNQNEPKRTETGRFEPVSVFLKKKIRFGYFFL